MSSLQQKITDHFKITNKTILKLTRAQILDFVILTLRWYLAYYMVAYGLGKMTDHQFGHRSVEILNTPLKDVDKFNLAWHLFSLDKTFDMVVGASQIIGAVLIVINRTTLVGALVLLPILGQIFLIDVAFTTDMFGAALPVRLSGMILADLLILYYYKDKIDLVWNNLTNGTTTKFNTSGGFLFSFLFWVATDLIFGTLAFPIKLLIKWLTN